MASIGIDYWPGQWRLCLVEQGKATEMQSFTDAKLLLASLRQLCGRGPAPTIVVALNNISTPFVELASLDYERVARQAQRSPLSATEMELHASLQELRALSPRCYCAPAAEYLPTVPLYRSLLRPTLGSASEVSVAIALLHFMREQQASWSEMNFFLVHAEKRSTSILVIVNGQIVNGIGILQGSALASDYSQLASLGASSSEAEERTEGVVVQAARDEAFWEGLTQELGGLLALHHTEDMVVLSSRSAQLVERLVETYQVYHFPSAQDESKGYEAALGAALLGEGLEDARGSSGEVIERLQIRQARRERLMPIL